MTRRAAAVSASNAPRGGRLRSRGLSPLSWFVRGVLVLLVAVACWKGGSLGVDSARHWLFSRSTMAQDEFVAASAPEPSSALQFAVEQAATSPRGTVAVYAWDLNDGESAALEEHRLFPAASLVKLPVLVEVLRQERLGRFSARDELVIKQEHWTDGSGVLQARVGDRVTIGELTELMIRESDNIAARALMDLVGVDEINRRMSALGFTDTVVQPLESDSDTVRPPHQTSARDMAGLLGLIATGGVVDSDTSARAVSLLEAQQANAWLADGLPWWARLAHKWGDLANARHDAGIVFTPRGRYVVVVMTEGMLPGESAETIGRVSRAVFDRIGADTR